MDEDDYRINAIYYDGGYDSVETLVDIPFYVEEATRTGLEVLETYGSFARTPLDNEASDIIFGVRKP